MLKGLFQLLVAVLLGILIYNYFLGSHEEKATSKEIFSKAGELGKAAFQLLRSEKEKFDQGKYREAVDRVGGLINSLESKAKATQNVEVLSDLENLERRRRELEIKVTELERIKQSGNRLSATVQEAQVRKDWQSLINSTETILKQLESETPPR